MLGGGFDIENGKLKNQLSRFGAPTHTTTDRQKENCGNSKLYGNLEFHQNYHLLIRIPL